MNTKVSDKKSNRVFILGAGVGKCMDIPSQDGLFEAIMKFDYSKIGENHYDYKSDKEAISYFLRTYHKDLINENLYPGIEKVLEAIHKAHCNEEIKKCYDIEYINRYFNLNNMLYDYMWNQIRNGGRKVHDGIILRETLDYFVKKLKPDDIIINFNYDVAIENRLDILGKLWTYRKDGNGIKIYKVHGSINWVEMDRDEEISYRSSKTSLPITAKVKDWFEPLTECTEKYWVVKSPEGGRLLTTYFDLTTGKVNKDKKWEIPLIIPPMKEKYADKDLNIKSHFLKIIIGIRNNAWDSIKNANELYIIGYSFNCDQDKESVNKIFENIEKNKNRKNGKGLKICVVDPKINGFHLYFKNYVASENFKIIRKPFEKWVRKFKCQLS